jgi:putative oxidoreductase
MTQRFIGVVGWGLQLLDRLRWLPPLLMRIFVGYFFFETGFAKTQNIATFAQRFAGWNIPYPYFNAVLSAYTETIGGALIIAGLLTRIVSIPMMINMVVAIATVKIKQIASVDDFVEADEPLYFLVFFWLMFSGPGRVSLDYFFDRWIPGWSDSGKLRDS